jgi:hypothetical protein
LATAWEPENVLSIMAGVFNLNAKLESIAQDVAAIRRLIDDDEEEEEEAADDG